MKDVLCKIPIDPTQNWGDGDFSNCCWPACGLLSTSMDTLLGDKVERSVVGADYLVRLGEVSVYIHVQACTERLPGGFSECLLQNPIAGIMPDKPQQSATKTVNYQHVHRQTRVSIPQLNSYL